MQEGDRSIEFHLGPRRAADGKVNPAQRVTGVLPGLTSCYAHAAQPRKNHQADCEAHDVARIRAIHGLVWMSARESSACHVRLCRSLRRGSLWIRERSVSGQRSASAARAACRLQAAAGERYTFDLTACWYAARSSGSSMEP